MLLTCYRLISVDRRKVMCHYLYFSIISLWMILLQVFVGGYRVWGQRCLAAASSPLQSCNSHRDDLDSKEMISDHTRYPVEQSTPLIYQPFVDYIMIPEDHIQKRVDELGKTLIEEYSEVSHVYLLCVLKGYSLHYLKFNSIPP